MNPMMMVALLPALMSQDLAQPPPEREPEPPPPRFPSDEALVEGSRITALRAKREAKLARRAKRARGAP